MAKSQAKRVAPPQVVLQVAEKLHFRMLLKGFRMVLKGHGFSRAASSLESARASAPELFRRG
jgi:hypothetical protein